MLHFFKLPAELRYEIYKLALEKPPALVERKGKATLVRERWPGDPPTLKVHLHFLYFAEVERFLLVCRQFCDEIAPLLYGDTNFSADGAKTMWKFLEQIGPRNRASLKTLTFQIRDEEDLPDVVRTFRLLKEIPTPLRRLKINLWTWGAYAQEYEEQWEKYDGLYAELGNFNNSAVFDITVPYEYAVPKIERDQKGWNRCRQVLLSQIVQIRFPDLRSYLKVIERETERDYTKIKCRYTR
jgi:hypothetical protein